MCADIVWDSCVCLLYAIGASSKVCCPLGCDVSGVLVLCVLNGLKLNSRTWMFVVLGARCSMLDRIYATRS